MNNSDKYIYLIEKCAVRKNSLIDCEHIKGIKYLPIICYHINNDEKYPFIEFLLEKNANNQLDLPFIKIDSHTEDINYLLEKHIKDKLTNICPFYNEDNNIEIKGLINDSYEKIYALVDVSSYFIQYIKYTIQSNYCFVLPSEIINSGSTYDINIDENTRTIFYDLPELGVLHQPTSKKPYPLPDAVYSVSQLSQTEFNSVFGCNKSIILNMKKKYYYFNTQFTHNINYDISNNFVSYGINKYALFNNTFTIHIESNDQLSLTHNEVNSLLNIYNQIYIQYIDHNLNDIKVDIICRDYDDIIPLSYREIIIE